MKKREISRIKFYRKVVSELMLEFEQVGKVDEDGQRVDFKFKSLTKTNENVNFMILSLRSHALLNLL